MKQAFEKSNRNRNEPGVFAFRILSLLLLLMTLSIAGCSLNRVTVAKKPISVETKYLEDIKDKSKNPLGPKDQALTTWNFGSKADIAFDIIEKDLIGSQYLVLVKVKSVKVDLDAPTTIWISRTASDDLIKHENAHVLICKRVYNHAEKAATQCAEEVLDKTFQASGGDLDKALKAALDTARRQISECYHAGTVEEINRVSETFDELEKQLPDSTHEELVDKAFLQYKKITGI